MKNYLAYLMLFIAPLTFAMEKNTKDEQVLKNFGVCLYVLEKSKLKLEASGNIEQVTFKSLSNFFEKNNIKDYADAAKFGRENKIFDHPDSFNAEMGKLFIANSTDIQPANYRQYQAVVANTSGIDVFMERLAFLSRLVKSKALSTQEVVALVGAHAHRDDLINKDYLSNLPNLFAKDFDLTIFNKEATNTTITEALQKKKWTHKDGMYVAWDLVNCDTAMAELQKNFRCFSGNTQTPLRTEQLMEKFLAEGLQKPLSPENPIAFICNAQGAAKTSEMVRKIFAQHTDSVDILVAKPVPVEIEAQLFNDTPQQRAMVKLFHFFRILEVKNTH